MTFQAMTNLDAFQKRSGNSINIYKLNLAITYNFINVQKGILNATWIKIFDNVKLK